MSFSLDELSLAQLPIARQTALVRLQMYAIGWVHEHLARVARAASDVLEQGNPSEPPLLSAVSAAQSEALKAWDEWMSEYMAFLVRGLYVGAAFAFGELCLAHELLVLPNLPLQEQLDVPVPSSPSDLLLSKFHPRMAELVAEAIDRRYADGLSFSERIWRLDQAGQAGIRATLSTGIASGESAWSLARRLEAYLGANQDCPRWTSERLYGLTKRQIAAGDRTGLITGADCQGQGVALNALRLARTEIQYVHQQAAAMAYKRSPWVQYEQIFLSPEHPKPDICDDVVNGGRDNKGIYEVGQILLPLHPHCMCYRAPVMMSMDEFVAGMRAWLAGNPWPPMDGYADLVENVAASLLLDRVVNVLGTFLYGDEEEMTTWLG